MLNDIDYICLLFIFIIIVVIVYYCRLFSDDVDVSIITNKKNKSMNATSNANILNEDPLTIKYNNLKESNGSFNTYKDNDNINNDGYHNELMQKSNYKELSENVDEQFIEAKKNIPIDDNLSNYGFCPKSRNNKTDLPMQNINVNYLLDTNKSSKFSEEFIKYK